MKICIDPGHGGSDPGAVAGGVQEKDLTLAISLCMAQRAKELGFSVVLTRDTDKTLTPEQRADIVKKSGAKVCLSNHINSGGGSGVEVIHSIHSDGKFAGQVLNSIAAVGMPVRKIFSRRNSKGDADYYFMHRLTRPIETLIVEYGFIDSSADRTKLTNPEFKGKLVEAVLRAVCNHTGILYTHPGKEEAKLDWKDEIMQEAVRLGLIQNEQHKPDEPASKWFVLAVLMNMMKKDSSPA